MKVGIVFKEKVTPTRAKKKWSSNQKCCRGDFWCCHSWLKQWRGSISAESSGVWTCVSWVKQFTKCICQWERENSYTDFLKRKWWKKNNFPLKKLKLSRNESCMIHITHADMRSAESANTFKVEPSGGQQQTQRIKTFVTWWLGPVVRLALRRPDSLQSLLWWWCWRSVYERSSRSLASQDQTLKQQLMDTQELQTQTVNTGQEGGRVLAAEMETTCCRSRGTDRHEFRVRQQQDMRANQTSGGIKTPNSVEKSTDSDQSGASKGFPHLFMELSNVKCILKLLSH